MPGNVSSERKALVVAYGAEIVYSDPLEGSDGAILKVRELVEADPDRYFYPDQYSNPANVRAHYDGTAIEILEQTSGRVTHFVAGLGTTGRQCVVGWAGFQVPSTQVARLASAERHGLLQKMALEFLARPAAATKWSRRPVCDRGALGVIFLSPCTARRTP